MNSRARALIALLALVLTGSLVLAACGGGDQGKKAEDRPSSQPTQGGTKLAAVWPLTGLPAPDAAPDHPVMIVKIDNTASSQPQVGVGKADMVVEELVEGGITRLATMFYSQLPKVAGPVRSMRATDIGIVKPTHAVLVASGAAPPTYARLKKAKVTFFAGGPGFYRDSHGRHAPYNFMVKLPVLAKSIKKDPVVPASYLPWGKDTDFAGGQPATQIQAHFSRSTTTLWKYDAAAKKYDNTNSHAGRGDRFRPDSVLVLRVRVGDAGYLDPAGHHVPETLFYGTGNALLFHNGQVTRGTWSKAQRDTPLQLATAAGPMKVPAGHVWIELVPVEGRGGSVTFR